MFEAGRVAAERGWAAPEIVSLNQIGGMSPTGPSAIAIGDVGQGVAGVVAQEGQVARGAVVGPPGAPRFGAGG